MNLLNRNALRRQQELVTALRTSGPVTLAKQAAVPGGVAQSHDPENPGSDVYPYSSYSVGTYNVWHFKLFAIYPTAVTYLIPDGPVPEQGFPVIAASGGKFLDHPTAYMHLLAHLCRKGYVVLLVDADTGPLDCQHTRMAGEFLEAIWKTIAKKLGNRATTPPRLAWWGHSMGAKVQAIAAAMTTHRYYLRPTAIIANNFSNASGGLCDDDALTTAASIPTNLWYTLIRGDQDTIAGDDPRRLYDALHRQLQRRFVQLLRVNSYPQEKLTADHDAPLTDKPENPLVVLVGGPATLDALDWWLYWKIAVGAFDFHFKNKSKKWAYGDERENGGTDPNGFMVRHTVEFEMGS